MKAHHPRNQPNDRVIAVDGDRCGYCGGCVIVCHDDAIDLLETRLTINERCTFCNACEVFCTVGALAMEQTEDHLFG